MKVRNKPVSSGGKSLTSSSSVEAWGLKDGSLQVSAEEPFGKFPQSCLEDFGLQAIFGKISRVFTQASLSHRYKHTATVWAGNANLKLKEVTFLSVC